MVFHHFQHEAVVADPHPHHTAIVSEFAEQDFFGQRFFQFILNQTLHGSCAHHAIIAAFCQPQARISIDFQVDFIAFFALGAFLIEGVQRRRPGWRSSLSRRQAQTAATSDDLELMILKESAFCLRESNIKQKNNVL